MKKRVGMSGLTICLATCLALWGTHPAASESIEKRSSFSGQAISSRIADRTEEAWLLWKLGRKKEAREVALPLLEKNPDNPELMPLCASIYLDSGDMREARALIERMETLPGADPKSILEFKGTLLTLEGKPREAIGIYRTLLKDHPENWDYQRSYAALLATLNLWQESKEAYNDALGNEIRRHEIIWDYREVNQQASAAFDADYEYVLAPESLREYRLHQQLSVWLHPQFRFVARAIEEEYTKPTLGDAQKILKSIAGHYFRGDWLLNEYVMISPYLETDYMGGHAYQEEGCTLLFDSSVFNSNTGFYCGHLVRSPVESLVKIGRSNKFWTVNELKRFYPFVFGNLFELEWYWVRPEMNQVNGEPYLGYKLWDDVYGEVVLLERPHLSFNFHYKHAKWFEPFDGAEQVLDFIKAEEVYYGGFYMEERIGNIARVWGSISRTYDHKRRFYSTISNGGADLWIGNNIIMTFMYEYGYNVNGTLGPGCVQVMTTKLKVLF